MKNFRHSYFYYVGLALLFLFAQSIVFAQVDTHKTSNYTSSTTSSSTTSSSIPFAHNALRISDPIPDSTNPKLDLTVSRIYFSKKDQTAACLNPEIQQRPALKEVICEKDSLSLSEHSEDPKKKEDLRRSIANAKETAENLGTRTVDLLNKIDNTLALIPEKLSHGGSTKFAGLNISGQLSALPKVGSGEYSTASLIGDASRGDLGNRARDLGSLKGEFSLSNSSTKSQNSFLAKGRFVQNVDGESALAINGHFNTKNIQLPRGFQLISSGNINYSDLKGENPTELMQSHFAADNTKPREESGFKAAANFALKGAGRLGKLEAKTSLFAQDSDNASTFNNETSLSATSAPIEKKGYTGLGFLEGSHRSGFSQGETGTTAMTGFAFQKGKTKDEIQSNTKLLGALAYADGTNAQGQEAKGFGFKATIERSLYNNSSGQALELSASCDYKNDASEGRGSELGLKLSCKWTW